MARPPQDDAEPTLTRIRARRAPPILSHPIDPPAGSTHFRLRKGGRSGSVCYHPNAKGVEREHHPIEEFSADLIRTRWGSGRDYWVVFSNLDDANRRHTLGPPQALRLPDPSELVNEAELVPPGTGYGPPPPTVALDPGVAGPMAMVLALRDITGKDSAERIAGYQVQADAALRATRDAAAQQTSTLLEVFKLLAPSMHAPPAAPATDPVLVQVLARLAEGQERLERLLTEEEETEEAEEVTDEERLEALVRAYRKGRGMAAVQEYLEDQSVAGLVKMWPKIKAKLPDLVSMLAPQLQTLLGAPAVPVVANGQAPAPRAPREMRPDPLTPKVE